ncbi:MAG: cobalamin-dependent protein [Gluconacetobacter diazotrophicus]|nr:cobalamin-dependent protein [Gluconacetobacter diazotrophicus]
MTGAGIEASIGSDTTGAGVAESEAIGIVIAERVLPELLCRHVTAAARGDAPDAAAIGRLADIAATGTEAALLCAVADLALPPGLPALCDRVLTPVARELGERWVRDELDFTAVTLGAARLHAALRMLGVADGPAAARGVHPRTDHGTALPRPPRLLLLPTPGEDHGLGLAMVAALFRDAGWRVRQGGEEDAAAPEAILDAFEPDMVGFSVACDRHRGALGRAVRRLRRARPAVPVIGGGPLFGRRPGLVRTLGLDAAFADGTDLPARAARLLRAPDRAPGADRTPEPNRTEAPRTWRHPSSTRSSRDSDRSIASIGTDGIPGGVLGGGINRPGRAGCGGDPQDRAGDR